MCLNKAYILLCILFSSINNISISYLKKKKKKKKEKKNHKYSSEISIYPRAVHVYIKLS